MDLKEIEARVRSFSMEVPLHQMPYESEFVFVDQRTPGKWRLDIVECLSEEACVAGCLVIRNCTTGATASTLNNRAVVRTPVVVNSLHYSCCIKVGGQRVYAPLFEEDTEAKDDIEACLASPENDVWELVQQVIPV